MKQCNKSIIQRINRLEGQIHGIKNMIQEEKGCEDIITQLTAIRSATNRLIGLILIENYKDILESDDIEDKEELLKRIEQMIMKK